MNNSLERFYQTVELGNRVQLEGYRENFQRWEMGYHVYILMGMMKQKDAGGTGKGGDGIQYPNGGLGSDEKTQREISLEYI